MNPSSPRTLDPISLRSVFIDQLSILYNAKVNLTDRLPQLVDQATFRNLKLALNEDLEDTKRQMISLKEIFNLMHASWLTDKCLAMTAVIDEAHRKVVFNANNHFESDMSILFYMSVIENLQLGAIEVLDLIALKLDYQPYAQLIRECLDIVEENCSLFHHVAEEYLQH
jgi:ferritin-like metal-binding protein YciE